jgi:hypothetical protein
MNAEYILVTDSDAARCMKSPYVQRKYLFRSGAMGQFDS